ncbi:AsnC family transcriptional regulator, partial [Rhizobium phaseoli]
DRELGIDRYFTYIVTKTVKEETVLPVSSFAGSGEDQSAS